jgi:hypothetical protein
MICPVIGREQGAVKAEERQGEGARLVIHPAEVYKATRSHREQDKQISPRQGGMVSFPT